MLKKSGKTTKTLNSVLRLDPQTLYDNRDIITPNIRER